MIWGLTFAQAEHSSAELSLPCLLTSFAVLVQSVCFFVVGSSAELVRFAAKLHVIQDTFHFYHHSFATDFAVVQLISRTRNASYDKCCHYKCCYSFQVRLLPIRAVIFCSARWPDSMIFCSNWICHDVSWQLWSAFFEFQFRSPTASHCLLGFAGRLARFEKQCIYRFSAYSVAAVYPLSECTLLRMLFSLVLRVAVRI